MVRLFFVATFALFGGVGSGFAAEKSKPLPSVAAEVPIYSQKIRFQLPSDWKHIFTDQTDDSYLIEFIPKKSSLENWTDLFSLQGHKGFKGSLTPEQVSNNIATGFVKTCPKTAIYTKLGARKIDGHDAFLSVIGCSNMPSDGVAGLKKGMSEISYYVVMQGDADLYVAHKSVRGVGFKPNKFPPFVEASIEGMKLFFPFKFCKLDSPRGQCKK